MYKSVIFSALAIPIIFYFLINLVIEIAGSVVPIFAHFPIRGKGTPSITIWFIKISGKDIKD